MISLLVVSTDKEKRDAYALDFCKKKDISEFDITTVQPENSFGITEVRLLQKSIFLSPVKSKEKAVIIFDAHLATTEAQNALLKLLEEPPAHTILILTTATTNTFLPTILSRCSVTILDKPNDKTEQDISTEKKQLLEISSASIAHKLFLAQELAKDKENILPKLEKLLYAARSLMLENPEDVTYAKLTNKLSRAYSTAQNTNINVRMLLEVLFLSE